VAASHQPHKDYKQNDSVLLRINTILSGGNNLSVKVTGMVTEPGKESMDFAGYLDHGITPAVAELWKGKDCLATVTGVTRSNCGPSMWVKDIKKSPLVAMHQTDIPERIWNYVVANVSCHLCNKHVYAVDHPFTAVSKRIDGLRVTCGDCLEEKFEGKMKDEFAQRRLDALQDGQPVLQEPVRKSLSLVKPDNSPTLH
jgi:hypothetical protein